MDKIDVLKGIRSRGRSTQYETPPSYNTIVNMKPEVALSYLQKRGDNLRLSNSWDDLSSEEHSKAFTVANVLKADTLQNMFDKLKQGYDEGKSLSEIKKDLLEFLPESRLRTVIQTNIQVSYMNGRYNQQLAAAKAGLEYWQFNHVNHGKSTAREEHAKYNGLVFRYDDPIWKTLYPPRGYNCACRVKALTKSQVEKRGLKIQNGSDFSFTPDAGWEATTDTKFQPDLSKYASDIKAELAKALEEKRLAGLAKAIEAKRIKAEAVAEAKAKAEAVAEAKAKAEAVAEAKAKAEAVAEAKAKAEAVAEAKAKADEAKKLAEAKAYAKEEVELLLNSNSDYAFVYQSFTSGFWREKRMLDYNNNNNTDLTIEECAAVHYYTSKGNNVVNRYLRGKSLSASTKDIAPALTNILLSALKKMPPVKAGVYRGQLVDKQTFDLISTSLKSGDPISLKSFSSTSLDRSVAESFKGGDKREVKDNSYVMVISCKDGRDISLFSRYTSEAEVLIMPNAKLRVISINTVTKVITMEEI